MPLRRPLLSLACLGLLLSALPARAADDPFEGVNRRIHSFNQALRAHVLGPLAEGYAAIAPPGMRQGIAQAMSNLAEPVTAVSSLVAGEFDQALNALSRFGINTTLGLGGVRDRAAEMGYPRRIFALADAACSWGLPSGPYLVMPLLGPTTLRDAGALAVTSAALAQVLPAELVASWGASDAFVAYAGLHDLLVRVDADSLDAYAVHRSAYFQHRAARCAPDRARLLVLGAADAP